jgi:hypothetical protein
MSDVNVPRAFDEDEREQTEVWREGITMALYISLSQLAVMTAMPAQEASANTKLALTVALTTVGLVLAHQVAFRMSSRLVAPGSRLEPLAPILICGPDAYLWSIGLLLLFVMVVGYLVARSAPYSRLRSLIYVLVVAVIVIGVLAVKSLVNH